MEASAANSDVHRGSSGNIGGVGISTISGGSSSSSLRRDNSILAASNIIRSPISTLLEYSGILRTRSNHQESEPLFGGDLSGVSPSRDEDSGAPAINGEVSIRIIGAGEQENHREREGLVVGLMARDNGNEQRDGAMWPVGGIVAEGGEGDAQSGVVESSSQSTNGTEGVEGGEASGRQSSYQQRYDIQQATRYIEQILPFSLLLLWSSFGSICKTL